MCVRIHETIDSPYSAPGQSQNLVSYCCGLQPPAGPASARYRRQERAKNILRPCVVKDKTLLFRPLTPRTASTIRCNISRPLIIVRAGAAPLQWKTKSNICDARIVKLSHEWAELTIERDFLMNFGIGFFTFRGWEKLDLSVTEFYKLLLVVVVKFLIIKNLKKYG